MSLSFSQTYLPFLLWFSALIFSLMPFDAWQDHFLFAAVGLLFTSAVILVVQMRDLLVPHRVFLILGGAFWALALLSVFLSEARGVSFVYFCFFSAFPISALMFYQVASQEKILHLAVKMLVGFYAVLAISSIVQAVFFPDMLMWGLVKWPLSNPNSLAGLLSLGLFGVLGIMLGSNSRVVSNACLVLALLILTAIFTTGSRGATIAMVLAGAVFLFSNLHFVRKHARCLIIFAALGLVSFYGVGLFGEYTSNKSIGIVSGSLSGEMPLLWSRPEIWASTFEIAKDYFWTGTGIGTFFLYYPEYRGDDPLSSGWTAHCDPLQFWAEMGVFGVVLFYLFCGVAVWRCVCAVKGIDADDPKRLWILTPFCALGAMLAHAHVSFHFNILPILFVAGAVLGMWMRGIREESGLHALSISAFARGSVVGGLLLVLAVFAVVHSADMLVTRGRASLNAGDSEAYMRDINLAGKISARRNPRAFVSAALIPLSVLEQQGNQISKDDARAQFNKGMALLAKAERYNPRLVPIYLLRAQLIEAGKEYVDLQPGESVQDKVEAELVKGRRMNPFHLETKMALARFYLKTGRGDEGYALLKDRFDWPYDSPLLFSYYQLLIQQAAERGDAVMKKRGVNKLAYYMREHFVGQSGP